MKKYTIKQIATVDEAYHQEDGNFYLIYRGEPVGEFADCTLAENVRDLLNGTK